MFNPTYPAGGADGGGGPALSGIRRYLGSVVIASSRTWSKAEDLAGIVAGLDPNLITVDLECIGGGAGPNSTANGTMGGEAAPPAWLFDLPLSSFPSTAVVTIGAGGPLQGADGGATRFGDLLVGRGGVAAGHPGSGEFVIRYQLWTYLNGPGHGAGQYLSIGGERAYDSSAGRPAHRLAAGGEEGGGADGRSATTPWQYGSGGGRAADPDGAGGYRGGRGGWPGGGGGSTASTSYKGGPGGHGAARVHVFTREPA